MRDRSLVVPLEMIGVKGHKELVAPCRLEIALREREGVTLPPDPQRIADLKQSAEMSSGRPGGMKRGLTQRAVSAHRLLERATWRLRCTTSVRWALDERVVRPTAAAAAPTLSQRTPAAGRARVSSPACCTRTAELS